MSVESDPHARRVDIGVLAPSHGHLGRRKRGGAQVVHRHNRFTVSAYRGARGLVLQALDDMDLEFAFGDTEPSMSAIDSSQVGHIEMGSMKMVCNELKTLQSRLRRKVSVLGVEDRNNLYKRLIVLFDQLMIAFGFEGKEAKLNTDDYELMFQHFLMHSANVEGSSVGLDQFLLEMMKKRGIPRRAVGLVEQVAEEQSEVALDFTRHQARQLLASIVVVLTRTAEAEAPPVATED